MERMDAEPNGVQTPLMDVPYAIILKDPVHLVFVNFSLAYFGMSNNVSASNKIRFFVIEQVLRHKSYYILEEAK